MYVRTTLLFVSMAAMLAAGVTPLATLEQQAKQRLGTTARVPLAAPDAEVLRGIEGRITNDVRAMALVPNAVRPYAKLYPTFIYQGTVEPETKLAMGLRIAQINGSPYMAARTIHGLRASDRGKRLLDALRTDGAGQLSAADALALDFAAALTQEVHGLNDADFGKVRGVYNDSQVVELTFTVCLLNYMTRLAEAVNLPVEPWVLEAPAPLTSAWKPTPSRVALLSDDEATGMAAVVEAARNPQGPTASWGIGVASSIRAMMRVPALANAWRGFGTAAREKEDVTRETKLHVSFAVSMVNGCRYCTLHQVLGLRRLGVNPSKLMALKKNDEALTARERTAVVFARKLTREPGGTTDADYQALRAEFGERGAMEVLMQTCSFAFMNRFTDGLRLPSEDEAIKVYRETYGGDFSSN